MESKLTFYIPRLIEEATHTAFKDSLARVLAGRSTNVDASIVFTTIQSILDKDEVAQKRKARYVSKLIIPGGDDPKFIQALVD